MSLRQKRKRPLICYAGSAAETSIGSKPIGSELNPKPYSKDRECQDFPVTSSNAYGAVRAGSNGTRGMRKPPLKNIFPSTCAPIRPERARQCGSPYPA